MKGGEWMFCKKCGRQIGEDQRFCKHCGSRVSENEASVGPETEEVHGAGVQPAKKKKHWWLVALVVLVAVVFTVLMTVVVLLRMGYLNFDSTTPDTGHTHKWVEADCETPKTCADCGETVGSATGHSWTDLISEEKMECSVCGAIEYYCRLNDSDVTMIMGESFALQLFDSDGVPVEVCWTAENERVSISGNTITGVSPGNAMVTAEYRGRTYSCIVRVRLPKHVTPQNILYATSGYVAAVHNDGTIGTAGKVYSQDSAILQWSNLVAIAGNSGSVVGLKTNGTVVQCGYNDPDAHYDVSTWQNIVQVCKGTYHVVGLRADGTVVALGNNAYGETDLDHWADIVAVAAGDFCTIGLKSDGTVVVAGGKGYLTEVLSWTDLVAIEVGHNLVVGLKADGTVLVACGGTAYYEEVAKWNDIVTISTQYQHIVGLKADGTVVAAGDNSYNQCEVADWKDVVAVYAGSCNTVAVQSDGTVMVVGDNSYGQCDRDNWNINQSNVQEGKAAYQVTVLFPDGTPVAGAYVMICNQDLVYSPAKTDENGVVSFQLPRQDGYGAKLCVKVDGYILEDWVYFHSGATELTIYLQKE